MNRVLRTFFFAATSGTSAAGLAVLFIVLYALQLAGVLH